MKITKVTFTGADDTTNLKDLKQISKEYPFVEWGILYSEKQSGKGGRYPTEDKIKELTHYKNGINTAVHLCGKVVADFLKTGFLMIDKDLYNHADRVQLNFNAKRNVPDMQRLMNGIDFHLVRPGHEYQNNMHKRVIFQVNENNQQFIDGIAPFVNSNDYHFLFDASGGRGTEIKNIPQPIEGKYCGYAGGLNPDNLKSVLEKLEKQLPEDLEIWIDMETGVRTNDVFSLSKVKKCLKIISEYEKN